MEGKKHTEEEIVLGLSCCASTDKCMACPYYINKYSCDHKTLMIEAVDLIQNYQTKKENEDQNAKGKILVARNRAEP